MIDDMVSVEPGKVRLGKKWERNSLEIELAENGDISIDAIGGNDERVYLDVPNPFDGGGDEKEYLAARAMYVALKKEEGMKVDDLGWVQ